MRVSRLASVAAVAVMLAAAPVLLSASDSDKGTTAEKPAATVSSASVPAPRLATLKTVKAAPMSSTELDAVKGQHAHFWNPGAPLGGEPHVVNSNNDSNWLDLGNGELVGPGYHGLCKANVKSSAIFINPGGGC